MGGKQREKELCTSRCFSLKHVWMGTKLGHRVTIICSWAFCRSSTIKAPHTDGTTMQQSELTLIHTQFVTHTLIDHRLSSHPRRHGQSTCCNTLICICACVQHNPVNHMKRHNNLRRVQSCTEACTTVNRWTRSLLASSLGGICWSWISSLMWL